MANGHVVKWLPLGLVVGAGLIAWGATTAQLGNVDQRAAETRQRVERLERAQAEQLAALARIEAEQKAVKEALEGTTARNERLLERILQEVSE